MIEHGDSLVHLRASQMAQMVKNQPFGAFEGLGKQTNHVAPSGGQQRNNLEVSCCHQQRSVVWWSGATLRILDFLHGHSWQSSFLEESSRKNIYFCFIDYTKTFDCVDHNKLWKILQEMGIPDHLTCLLRNLYAGQKATVRTGLGTTNWFQTGKGVRQGHILSPCLFNLYADFIMWNARLDETQAGIKIAGRKISITSDMQMTPPLWQRAKRN